MYNLSNPQKNIWNLHKIFPNSSICNLCGSMFFKRLIDKNIIEQAINKVVENQSGIRLQFCEKNNNVYQYTAEYQYFNIPERDFENKEQFENYAHHLAANQFKMIDSPMFQFLIFKLNGFSGVLVYLNHIISDAWSFSLLAKEINNLCLKFENGNNAEYSSFEYTDYVITEQDYQKSDRFQNDMKYWKDAYSEKPEICPVKLSVNRTVADNPTAKRYTTVLLETQAQKINSYCSSNNISQAVIFETALILYLSRLNSQNKKITIGFPVLNRKNKSEKSTIGMFVSTLPLTVEIFPYDTLSDVMERITKKHREIFRHQRYSYSDIISYIRHNTHFDGNLYDTVVSYQNAQTKEDVTTQWFCNGYSESQFVLNIDDRDNLNNITLTIDYQTELFYNEEEVRLLLQRLMLIVNQEIDNPKSKVENIKIVPPEEYQKIIYDFNNTYAEYPKDKCVHEIFCEYAENFPDKAALIFENSVYTYKKLDEISNALAHYLRENVGIKPNDIVPIIANRDWHIVAAMLGVFKAGGAYMPIDPSFPIDRIKYMCDDVSAKIVLTHNFGEKLTIPMLHIDTFNYNGNISKIVNVNSPKDRCYVLFTSGSTGKPKATAVTHKNLVNFACGAAECQAFLRNYCKTVLATAAFTFDISIFEIYFSLLNGMTIILANDNESISALSLAKLIKENHVDLIHSTPTKTKMFIQNNEFGKAIKNLKAFVIGAESFNHELFNKITRYTKAAVFNGYGPSETTVGVSFKRIESYDDNTVDITIGKPISNVQIYILNENREPMPIGTVGELYISGDSVGSGYLNSELTSKKFVSNPFIPYKTMYQTGDLARWRIDGDLEFFGRKDTQVKIRGMRVELGEIENMMSTFDGISMAAVTDKCDENGHQYLVGYYTETKHTDEKNVRKYLLSKLPLFMVPNYFVKLNEMPLTAGGKIDRKKLPMPDFSYNNSDFISPETETEKKIAEIWRELLNIEKISKTDNFFDLGGDSLLAISMLCQIESIFNTEIGMKVIFEKPVLEYLASYISEAESSLPVIQATNLSRYILLPQQKAIYAVCRKNPNTLAYNMPAKIVLSEKVDRNRLKGCFRKIVEINPSLRTTIKADGNKIYGVVEEPCDIEFEEYTTDEVSNFVRPFDLENGPLFRIGFTKNALLFDMHHIITDGKSLNIIIHELEELYNGERVIGSAITYADYSQYFYATNFEKHKSFFSDMLKCDFEPMLLPERKYHLNNCGVSKEYRLDKETTAKSRLFARENNLTDTMLFLGAYGILLSKFSNRQNVLSSVILSNRVHKETQNIVGMFVNTLPFAINVNDKISEYFINIKQLVLGLFEFQEFPFLEIADLVGLTDKSVINTSFVYQADGVKKLSIAGNEILPQFMDTHTAKFDIMFDLTPCGDEYLLRIEYDSGKYDKEFIDRLYEAYRGILCQLNKNDISDISVISDAEYKKVIFDFNNTLVEYNKDKCIHELFSLQALKYLNKAAVVFEGRMFSYARLELMSNSLAHYLRESVGIVPNDIVPIIAHRSYLIVAAMLGVLKAGGAYMPVDPTYPVDRIQYMINQAKCKTALICDYKETLETKTIDLQQFDYNYNTESISNCNVPENLCYLIFTSGSTGNPKGTMITHANVINYADNNKNNVVHKIIKDTSSNIVSVTNFVFDIFVTESILPLLNGFTIFFANDEEVFSQKKLSEVIINNKIDVIQTTPTKMRGYMLDRNNLEYLKILKVIILGGEALTADLYSDIIQYTDAEIYNIYGPAETTVWSTNAHITSTDITIGKPIANTQIYILDNNRQPLPIGVAGELCVSGDGVGKGYLNLPELTAEKFIPNPFINGKTMYCTGDLARWRNDGSIEYLGRIDTQVKIRGLRIELGEIESAMNGFRGIRMTAVTDKCDEKGHQYIVGYYTSEIYIDERQLRQHLAAKLPKYMIPNYFMRLQDIPMTASGKTDRKNLPIPQFSLNEAAEYIEPKTEMEIKLCSLLSELLEVEKVGVSDDFFDIGGDSLTAIEYVVKAHSVGIEIKPQNVFEYPTVQDLCEYLENGTTKKSVIYKHENFEKYDNLLKQNTLTDNFTPQKKTIGDVLLTGSTGFLGAHILDALMQNETGKIYCLVRGSKEKLIETLHYYFGNKYDNEVDSRIITVIGDITLPYLSDNVPKNIQTVFHAAATVKHYGQYDYFYKVNVKGTRNVINYAKQVNAKLIHISTISVSGNSFADAFTIYRSENEKHFDEQSLYIDQSLENVYIRSKFEGELSVLDAMLAGIDAKIIRVGNLTNRTGDYKFQPNYKENAFLTRVKAALEFGKLPDYIMPLYAEFSPVNETAEGVIRIAQYADRQNIFHLNSNKPIYFTDLIEALKKLRIPIETVSGNEFSDILKNYANEPKTEYIYKAFQNDMDDNGKLVYDSNIRIINKFTVQFLRKIGFEWTQIDFEYIKGYVEYFRNLGYLEV